MSAEKTKKLPGISPQAEEQYLAKTLAVIQNNIQNYGRDVSQMRAQIDDMLEHFHDDNPELINMLENTITMHDSLKKALERNERALAKPYFGRIDFYDETYEKDEALYIGRGGIAKDATHSVVVDWRAPVANAYYENGLGRCSYPAPDGKDIHIDLKLKRTYEIENGQLQNFFDSEVIANDDLLTKYLAKNKEAVLGEIVATIQKEQNDIIRKSPYHNCLVQGVAGSGKTTVAMHRISYILYNYAQRFRPEDFYIVGSNKILLNYITSVLPGLDVHGVRQMTMEQLFVRLLYEDWDDKKYRIRTIGHSSEKSIVKGTLSWFRDLEAYCSKLEWHVIPRQSIYLNPRQFVEGLRGGKSGVFDETDGKPARPEDLVLLMDEAAVERYIRQNPTISIQSKINMLNERLENKIKDEFLGKEVKYTLPEKKAILRAYRGRYGAREWKHSIYKLYEDFLKKQIASGKDTDIPANEFDLYDLAALAYLYKRVKETEVISEAHHVVIDEAQDFGMMAYSVLKFCIKDCTYTIMGDVSQNIHFGCGLNDWEELRRLYLKDPMSSFNILKKSYRNTVEISNFAMNILHHGQFSVYPAEPIIRHGNPVDVRLAGDTDALFARAANICKDWQARGLDTIAVICRHQESAAKAAARLGQLIEIMESDLEKAQFGKGILVLPVEYTKGLEFDAVLILDPTRRDYPVEDGHAKLLYVAATRALHELCVLHTGELTGLIADPLPEKHTAVVSPAPTVVSPKAAAPASAETNLVNRRADKGAPASTQRPLPKAVSAPQPAVKTSPGFSFGDMPATEILRPMGHAKIDTAIRWVTKQADGLYLQSRYGVLRLSPVGSGIIRVTFARGSQIANGTHPLIAVTRTERMWMYKDSSKTVELLTDELCLQVDKTTGAIRYMTRDKNLLLEESGKQCRLIEATPSGNLRCRIFLNWQKGENLYALGPGQKLSPNLRAAARYVSHGTGNALPLLLSDKGYGLLPACSGPAFCCDVATYGSHLCMEDSKQMDCYFIAGRQMNTLLGAYTYLCN